jgi:hypothetical protein
MISRCWLEIDAIVKRLTQLKLEYVDELQVRKVYISTNVRSEWVDSLEKALLSSGWQSALSTHDLELTWEESGVNTAIGTPLTFLPPTDSADTRQTWSSPAVDNSSSEMAFRCPRPQCTHSTCEFRELRPLIGRRLRECRSPLFLSL